jgi:hypothetical protein
MKFLKIIYFSGNEQNARKGEGRVEGRDVNSNDATSNDGLSPS